MANTTTVCGIQIPAHFVSIKRARMYKLGSKWILATRKGARVASFMSEDALVAWWRAFHKSQGRSPPPLVVGAPRIKSKGSTSPMSPSGPKDPARPWSEKYDMPEWDYE